MVDDEKAVVESISKIVDWGAFGYTLTSACLNGFQALDAIRKDNPDIVITDIRMPDMDGLAFVAALRENHLRARVIMLSGYAEFEYARQALRLGVDNYLLKPLDRRELRETLQKIAAEMEGEAAQGTEWEEKEDCSEISRIMADIDYNFTKDFSLNDLAEKYAVSISNLSGIIKRETGKTFTEHVSERRVRKAEELLKNEKYSVAEVGKMVGYNDYYYFTKWFKKLTGVTPSKYRSGRKEKFQ